MGSCVDVGQSDFRAQVLELDVRLSSIFGRRGVGHAEPSPHIEALGTGIGAKVKVAKVNVDNNQQLAVTYGIRGFQRSWCLRAVRSSIGSTECLVTQWAHCATWRTRRCS